MIVSVKQAIELIENNGGQLTRQAVYNWGKEIPLPSFFISVNGKTKIDTENSEWLRRVNNPAANKQRQIVAKNAKTKKEEPEKEDIVPVPIPPRIPELPVTTEIIELEERARIAALNDTIFASKIREEKSKQEEIKTLELKKDLAPMYLMKHFYSFAGNMISRGYRRYEEISPELESLYLAGKKNEAVKLLLKEQESINHDCVADLKRSIIEEGYEFNTE